MPLAVEKENTQPKYDEDDDFVLLKKKPKFRVQCKSVACLDLVQV